MIPGLFFASTHGAPQAGLIGSPAYGAIAAYASGTSSASAQASLEMRPDGSFAKAGTGYASGSGSWYVPSQANIGAGYEVRMTTIHTGGSTGVVANGAGDWQPLDTSRLLTITSSRYTSGTSTANYNVIVEIRPAGGGAILSSATVSVSVSAEVQASGGGGNCVEVGMLLEPGLLAGDVQLGYRIECPEFDTESVVLLEVRNNTISPQPCWRIVTESGAAVVASDSTPMPLRGGGEAKLPEMLGREVLVADERGLTWERVIECRPVGMRDVVFINVGDNCYFAGEDAAKRIATHNATEQPK